MLAQGDTGWIFELASIPLGYGSFAQDLIQLLDEFLIVLPIILRLKLQQIFSTNQQRFANSITKFSIFVLFKIYKSARNLAILQHFANCITTFSVFVF